MSALSNADDFDNIELYKSRPTSFAADFQDCSIRKVEKDRREGTGPKFIRISKTCVKYRLVDLIEYQNERLAQNTICLLSEGGE